MLEISGYKCKVFSLESVIEYSPTQPKRSWGVQIKRTFPSFRMMNIAEMLPRDGSVMFVYDILSSQMFFQNVHEDSCRIYFATRLLAFGRPSEKL